MSPEKIANEVAHYSKDWLKDYREADPIVQPSLLQEDQVSFTIIFNDRALFNVNSRNIQALIFYVLQKAGIDPDIHQNIVKTNGDTGELSVVINNMNNMTVQKRDEIRQQIEDSRDASSILARMDLEM